MHGMSDGDGQPRIAQAVAEARRRWLFAAMVNAGGRWAVLPAFVLALIAVAVALAGFAPLWLLLTLSVLALLACAATLLLVRGTYAVPAAAGAPDWSLALDRAAGLGDALPACLESHGPFRPALEAQVAGGLTPESIRRSAPRKQWGPLAVALLLALLPLAFWQPDAADNPAPEQIAEGGADAPGTAGEGDPTGAGGSGTSGGNGEGEGDADTTASDGANGEGEGDEGTDGNPQGQADDSPSDAGGEPSPQAPPESDAQPGSPGDDAGEPEMPEQPEDPEFGTDIDRVRPEATDGETTQEERSRWVYNPDGRPESATGEGREIRQPGELAVPRTKVTSRERELIDRLYRRMFE